MLQSHLILCVKENHVAVISHARALISENIGEGDIIDIKVLVVHDLQSAWALLITQLSKVG